MNQPIDDGGTAFPTLPEHHGYNRENPTTTEGTPAGPGMTLRDWLAGQAMQALIAKYPIPRTDEEATNAIEKNVTAALRYADAMIELRKEGAA